MNNFQNQWEPGDPPEIDGPKKMTNHKTQAERILKLLEYVAPWLEYDDKHGPWVTLPEIMRLGIASHTKRISELRKRGEREGFKIEIRDERVGRERHVSYRLVK